MRVLLAVTITATIHSSSALAMPHAAPPVETPTYDRSIEAAAIRIVAARMGDIRGGFDVDRKVVFVMPVEPAFPAWRRDRQIDGMSLATGRRMPLHAF